MLYYEKKLKAQGVEVVIGIDEAGRGPLAGPVVAAAVHLRASRFKNRIDDSKKLTSLQREKAYTEILDSSEYGIGIVNEQVIDRINILVATRVAMEIAARSLIEKVAPNQIIHILIDGNMNIDAGFPSTPIVRGDCKSKSIAAASIVAKVTRDRIMSVYHKVYPQYGFDQHKGYPTILHKMRLREFGPSLIHRMSFHSEL